MHPIVDPLAGPRRLTRGDGGLEIDDAHLWSQAGKGLEGITPDVRKVDGRWDRTVRRDGECDIAQGRLHGGFVEARVAGVRQHLINASPDHHITAHEHGDGISVA